jgi:hypothetical protein
MVMVDNVSSNIALKASVGWVLDQVQRSIRAWEQTRQTVLRKSTKGAQMDTRWAQHSREHKKGETAKAKFARQNKRCTGHGDMIARLKSGFGERTRQDKTRLGGTWHMGAGAEVGLEIAWLLARTSEAFYTGSTNKGQSILRSSRKRVESELVNESAFR